STSSSGSRSKWTTSPWPSRPAWTASRLRTMDAAEPSVPVAGRVLVVEDDPAIAATIVAALEAAGHRVRYAPDAATAQRSVAEGVDAVVPDLVLRDADALGLLATRAEGSVLGAAPA